MPATQNAEHINTIVIGGGQAGLATGYHLARRGVPFLILDANERVGDSWRKRWDSLRLFTPARYDGLPGMKFPAPAHSFPSKDEMGDFLETYAQRFQLPVRTGTRVQKLRRRDGRFHLATTTGDFVAENVVVATPHYSQPWTPPFAAELDENIRQLHAASYRNPSQLQEGGVLVVGAGNSGAELAIEAANAGHETSLAGRHPGHIPFRIESRKGKVLVPFVVGFLFHHVMTERTPMGRKMRAKMQRQGGPLVRIKPEDIEAADVARTGRVAGTKGGLPILDDGTVLNVRNVLWCTGFRPDYSWIDLPVFGDDGEPRHDRGIARDVPGLYFAGQLFQYAASSTMIRGAGRDAGYVANAIAERDRATDAAAAPGEEQLVTVND